MANISSFDRVRIRRLAANPLILPKLPIFPREVKQKLISLQNAFERYDIDLESWRVNAQKVIEQAIMALKLDPGEIEQQIQSYINSHPEVIKAIIENSRVVINKLDKSGGKMTGRLLLLGGDPDAGDEAVPKDWVKREIASASGKATNLPIAKTLFVDSEGGNDTTAVRGYYGRPFRTIAKAIDFAISGDRIVLSPGTFALDSAFTLPANISLIGAGKNTTKLNFTITSDYAIRLSTGCVLSDLFIDIEDDTHAKSIIRFDTAADVQREIIIRDIIMTGYASRVAGIEGNSAYGLTTALLLMENVDAVLWLPTGTSDIYQGFLYGNPYESDVYIYNCRMAITGSDAINPIIGLELGASIGHTVCVTNCHFSINNTHGSSVGIKSRGTEATYYNDIWLDVPLTELELLVDPLIFTKTIERFTNPADDTFEVWNGGVGNMSYTITKDATWLSVTPNSGTSTGEHDTITVEYDTDELETGEYSAIITVTAAGAQGSPKTINISLTVNACGPVHDYGDDFEPYPIGIITNADRLCEPLTGPGYIRANYIRSLHNDIDGGGDGDTVFSLSQLMPPTLTSWNHGLKLATVQMTMPNWNTVNTLAVFVASPGQYWVSLKSVANPSYPTQWFTSHGQFFTLDCLTEWGTLFSETPEPTHYYIGVSASFSVVGASFPYISVGFYH